MSPTCPIISRYNAAVVDWVEGGLDEFRDLFFNMTDSSGIEYFHVINQTDGLYYPTRDSCKLKGDPKAGCTYTDSLYYDEDILWMMHDNFFTIYDREGRLIVDRKINGFMNITYTPAELRCSHTMYPFVEDLILVIIAMTCVKPSTEPGIARTPYAM